MTLRLSYLWYLHFLIYVHDLHRVSSFLLNSWTLLLLVVKGTLFLLYNFYRELFFVLVVSVYLRRFYCIWSCFRQHTFFGSWFSSQFSLLTFFFLCIFFLTFLCRIIVLQSLFSFWVLRSRFFLFQIILRA